MKTFDSPIELTRSITAFLIAKGASLSATTQDQLLAAQSEPSAAPVVVGTMEALYAVFGDLDMDGKMMCGQCADMVVKGSWYGKAERAAAIHQACLRELGEESYQTPDQDPGPDPAYTIAPPPPPGPPPLEG